MSELASLLARLHAGGFRLKARGADSLVVFPSEQVTPELAAILRRNKAELLELIRVYGEGVPPVGAEPEIGPVSWRLGPDGPGFAVVRSALLGENVVLVRSDAVPLPRWAAGLTTYTRMELAILASGSAENLRAIHNAKRILGGRLVALNALEDGAGRVVALERTA